MAEKVTPEEKETINERLKVLGDLADKSKNEFDAVHELILKTDNRAKIDTELRKLEKERQNQSSNSDQSSNSEKIARLTEEKKKSYDEHAGRLKTLEEIYDRLTSIAEQAENILGEKYKKGYVLQPYRFLDKNSLSEIKDAADKLESEFPVTKKFFFATRPRTTVIRQMLHNRKIGYLDKAQKSDGGDLILTDEAAKAFDDAKIAKRNHKQAKEDIGSLKTIRDESLQDLKRAAKNESRSLAIDSFVKELRFLTKDNAYITQKGDQLYISQQKIEDFSSAVALYKEKVKYSDFSEGLKTQLSNFVTAKLNLEEGKFDLLNKESELRSSESKVGNYFGNYRKSSALEEPGLIREVANTLTQNTRRFARDQQEKRRTRSQSASEPVKRTHDVFPPIYRTEYVPPVTTPTVDQEGQRGRNSQKENPEPPSAQEAVPQPRSRSVAPVPRPGRTGEADDANAVIKPQTVAEMIERFNRPGQPIGPDNEPIGPGFEKFRKPTRPLSARLIGPTGDRATQRTGRNANVLQGMLPRDEAKEVEMRQGTQPRISTDSYFKNPTTEIPLDEVVLDQPFRRKLTTPGERPTALVEKRPESNFTDRIPKPPKTQVEKAEDQNLYGPIGTRL